MALSATERTKLDDLLLIQFQLVDLPFVHVVFSYSPIGENNEPPANLLTDFLEFRNPSLQLAFPRIKNDRMDAILVHADTAFQKGAFNVDEPMSDESVSPAVIDLVLVPMLICDKEGYRVEYGKGYYDKYLEHCNPGSLKAGICYFEPIDEISDKSGFDVPLDLCITPYNVYVF